MKYEIRTSNGPIMVRDFWMAVKIADAFSAIVRTVQQ